MAIAGPGSEIHTPVGSQAFEPNVLPDQLLNMVKVPNKEYPVGNGAKLVHARMDIKEICYVINQLSAEAGVMSVTELPDLEYAAVGVTYRLTEPSDNEGILAPPGKYIFNSQGWYCVECCGMYHDTWSGVVDVVLVPGAHYWFNVTGNIIDLTVDLTTTGPCYVYLLNPDEYDINEPTVALTRTVEGLLRLNSQRVEVQLMGLGFGVIWSCVDLQLSGPQLPDEEDLPT